MKGFTYVGVLVIKMFVLTLVCLRIGLLVVLRIVRVVGFAIYCLVNLFWLLVVGYLCCVFYFVLLVLLCCSLFGDFVVLIVVTCFVLGL